MTCYYPNTAYVAGTRSTGSKIIHFGLPKKSDQESFLLPCGQCTGCRLDRSIMWAARCMHEIQMHDDSQFITLTYENEPMHGSLNPPDFVKFMKRYRKFLGETKIRFFHGAEYGDQLHRPHHHAIIFGHIFDDLEPFRECEGIITYYSPTLEKLWGHGFCTVGEATFQSAAYVARYCMKKVSTGKNSQDKHYAHYEKVCSTTGETRQILPEYATMSRRPGIGSEWYSKFHPDIFPHDTCIVKGKQVKTPRYYENLYRSTDVSAFEELKERRKQAAIAHLDNNTPERLRVREKVKLASMANLNRNLHNET